ncbi:hypothetical protein D1007_28770 [Hordeum vulgare]|uniref:Uncharacterized protein n=1 Tax=Hordeum vulgare subsp. vulgare TaxID=112509 RepID=A0A8I6XAM1_HORVV|nr:uncharacterized protein LOC123445655 [Hordeum vulgare subsp. vulgare]KAE8796256.1 hypothetical protein D1007_28770 [Hordeum vulgare]
MGNAGSATAPEQAKKPEEADAGGGGGAPPSTVRFFPAAAQHTARQPPPIKLEEEDLPPPPATAGEGVEEDMAAPRNLWQVYALGAFLVARWGWAKWKESKDRDDSADGQLPPPAASS